MTGPAGISATRTRGFGLARVVDVDADGGDDLVITRSPGAAPGVPGTRVLRSRGDGTFEDATGESGLSAVAVGLLLFGDVDGDGDPDLYAGASHGRGAEAQGVWLNDGSGRFRPLGPAGTALERRSCGRVPCTQQQRAGTLADFDGDGHLDLYVGSWFFGDGSSDARYAPPGRDHLYRGIGDGRFAEVTDALGVQAHPLSRLGADLGRAAMGVSAGDYDDDGDLDLFVANYGTGRPRGPLPDRHQCQPPRYWDRNFLWRNEGAGRWTDVGDALGVAATHRGPLAIASEPPLEIGDECPAEVRGRYPAPIGGNHVGSRWGDFDNDGDLDLVVGAIAHPDHLQSDPTSLFVNRGPPDYRFREEAAARGLRYRESEPQAAFEDVDQDGWLDVVTLGFHATVENELRLYRQEGDRFTLLDPERTGVHDRRPESAVWLDADRDGDLDLFIAHEDAPARLFRNDAADANHHLSLDLVARAPRDATGARVALESSAGRQSRRVTSADGHLNPQPSRTLSFGLGGDRCAARVRIRWPDGEEQHLGHVRADLHLRVTQGGAVEILGEARPLSRLLDSGSQDGSSP